MPDTSLLSSPSQLQAWETVWRWEPPNPRPSLAPKTPWLAPAVAKGYSVCPGTTESLASQPLTPAANIAAQRITSEARLQLDRLSKLQAGWNDASPVPNERTFVLAEHALDMLDEAGFAPSSVVPDAEGGISVYFFGAGADATRRYASVSCSNEGEVVALIHDKVAEPRAWNVGADRSEMRAAIERIRTFLLT